MSNVIEREIVQMVFDEKEFKSGVRGSIEEIERLKKALDFEKSKNSFAHMEKASRLSFNPMAASLDAINGKLSIAGIAAAAFVTRVTNSVIDGVKKLANVLVLDPIRTGLEEYETQLNSVQTILANTAKDGTNLQQVTDALDELNLYADQTIYNFTQMTDSIGKFTTAGVDLDTSVTAIKGIANVAALSGSNAQQASTAMYQLSQAISSGTVRLQDWISVENAGMGGQLFRDSIVETARLSNESVDRLIEKAGGFRNSLKEGWLSSEILLQTLAKFTGDLTDAELAGLGYTQEQIESIQETAILAADAATKIKTLTQLKDTMAEAMQSGWAETWRIVFGDFEEAKVLWGNIGTIFGDIIADSSDARNSMLDMWKSVGGRAAGVQAFMNIIQIVTNVIKAFGEAVRDIFRPLNYVDLFQITFAFLNFTKTMLTASENLEPFKSIVRGAAAALDILRLIIQAVLEPVIDLVRQLAPAGADFITMAASTGDAIVAFREFAIETDLFRNIVANIIAYLKELSLRVQEMVRTFLELDVVQDVVRWLEELERPDFAGMWEDALNILKAGVGIFYLMAAGAKELYKNVSELEVLDDIVSYFKAIDWDAIKDSFAAIGVKVKELVTSFQGSDIVAKFGEYFATFDGRRFEEFISAAKEGFSWLTGIVDTLTSKMGTLNQETDQVNAGASEIGTKIGESLEGILDNLIEGAGNIDYSKLFEIINTGLLAGLVLSVKSIASGNWLQNALSSVFGSKMDDIGGSIIGVFDGLEGALTSVQKNIKADTLQKIAIAIALLAGSIVLLTYIDSTRLLAATTAITVMVGALFGSSTALGGMNTAAAVKAAVAITGMATALVIIAGALQLLDGLEPGNIEVTLATMAAGLTALVLSVNGLASTNDAKMVKTVGILLSLSAALQFISTVIKKFSEMKPEELAQGLAGAAASLTLLVGSAAIMSKLNTPGLISAALAFADIAGALAILQFAVASFGSMDPNELSQGLQATGMALAGFAVYSQFLKPEGLISSAIAMGVMAGALLLMEISIQKFAAIGMEKLQQGLIGIGGALALLVIATNGMRGALPGALAMTIVSVALLALAAAMTVVAALGWEGLLVSLAGLAGVFTILGVAGLLLAPIVPVLLGIGAAMLLIGASAGLLGLGLGAAATGLVALAASSAAVAGAITVIGTAVIAILPAIGAAIAGAMTNFLTVLAQSMPKIVKAMQDIVLGMIRGITELIPEIVAAMMDMINALLAAVADRLPDMLKQGYEILLAFLDGIAENVRDIIATGLMIITEVINGIADGLPDLVDSAFNLILTFLNSIASAIEEYMPKIIAAGLAIGEALIKGVVNALGKGASVIAAKANEVAQKALDAFKAKFGIESPSKETYKIGWYVVQGFVNAILDKGILLKQALIDFGQKAQNGISPLIQALAQEIDNTLTFSPVITPVLNLDQITSGVSTVNRKFRGSPILASLEADGVIDSSITPQNQPTTTSGVAFYQYNYSPKALDRAAIYRQTKTQIAKLALKE